MAKRISIEEIAATVSARLTAMREEVKHLAQESPVESPVERAKKRAWFETRNQLRTLGSFMRGLPVDWTFTVEVRTLPPSLRSLMVSGKTTKEEELPGALQELMVLISERLMATTH